MSAGRRARLAALWVPANDGAIEAAEAREMLRFGAEACGLIREAMIRAGVDPGIAWAVREVEAKLAGFVDDPELRRADEALLAAADEEAKGGAEDDSGEMLIAALDRAAARFADGSMPDFAQTSLMVLFAWALQRRGEARSAGEEWCWAL